MPALRGSYQQIFFEQLLSNLYQKGGLPPKIDIPTLFIYGEKDKAILPQTVAGVGDIVSGSFTEHRIANSGHWVQQEQAARVVKLLRTFLQNDVSQ